LLTSTRLSACRHNAPQGAFLTALLPIVSHLRLAPLLGVMDAEFLLLCLITVYSCRRTGVMFYQVCAFSVFHRSHPFEGRSLIVSDRFAYLVFTSPHARSCAVL
jgi:hypothetical protein